MKTKKQRLKTLAAHTLVLRDTSGKTRILLDASDPDTPAEICLFSSQGASIALQVGPDNHCSIAIRRPGGRTAACLGVRSDGQAGLEIYDAQGKPCVMLSSRNPTAPTHLTIFGPLRIERRKPKRKSRPSRNKT